MSAYRRILVGVDGSNAANRGLREAIRLAGEERAQLVLLHVLNEYYAFATPDAAPPADVIPSLREGGRKILDKAAAAAERQGVKATKVLRETFGGSAANLIVREARRRRADVIVLGTHGRRGLRRMVLGSDAEQVVRTAPVPVLLVRSPD